MTKFEILTLISFSLSVVLTIIVINISYIHSTLKAGLRMYSDIVKGIEDILDDISDWLDRHEESIDSLNCEIYPLKGKVDLLANMNGIKNDTTSDMKHSDNTMEGGNEL